MASVPDSVRREPGETAFVVGLAAAFVFGALGWFTAAGVAFACGLGGAMVADVLTPDADPVDEEDAHDDTDEAAATEDALETLRGRYARGDLSDEQFERKLEALLETETPEDARERVDRTSGEYDDGEPDVHQHERERPRE